MRRQNAACRQLTAPLAQIGKAQNRIDKIIVGRQLERIDAGLLESRAKLPLAALGQGRSPGGVLESALVG